MRFAVITSINPPTDPIRMLCDRSNVEVVVVGDTKTPKDWNYEEVSFMNLTEQYDSYSHFASWIPTEHYSRKMLGYIRAVELGASSILDTDDDNYPETNLLFPPFEGSWECLEEDLGFINIYASFSDTDIWPRGHPLPLVNRDDSQLLKKVRPLTVGVWQALVNGDPDVDAIYRLTRPLPIMFAERDPLVLSTGTVAPFNSQSTLVRSEIFPLLYLPAHVTFRFTDILRGLVAQPIMWKFGFHLGFTAPKMTQKRNEHDLMQDFRQELPMYLHSSEVPNIVVDAIEPTRDIAEALREAYRSLVRRGIVPEQELEGLEMWLDLCKSTRSS